jgi:hypothetical protein
MLAIHLQCGRTNMQGINPRELIEVPYRCMLHYNIYRVKRKTQDK